MTLLSSVTANLNIRGIYLHVIPSSTRLQSQLAIWRCQFYCSRVGYNNPARVAPLRRVVQFLLHSLCHNFSVYE